jgi:hypothetical protein
VADVHELGLVFRNTRVHSGTASSETIPQNLSADACRLTGARQPQPIIPPTRGLMKTAQGCDSVNRRGVRRQPRTAVAQTKQLDDIGHIRLRRRSAFISSAKAIASASPGCSSAVNKLTNAVLDAIPDFSQPDCLACSISFRTAPSETERSSAATASGVQTSPNCSGRRFSRSMQARLKIGVVFLTVGTPEVFVQLLLAVLPWQFVAGPGHRRTKAIDTSQLRHLAKGQESPRVERRSKFLAQPPFRFPFGYAGGCTQRSLGREA